MSLASLSTVSQASVVNEYFACGRKAKRKVVDMNELTPTKEVKAVGATNKDSAMLRGLCGALNSGFTAPGGADSNTQKEIAESLKSDAAFKQPVPRPRNDIPAQSSGAKPKPVSGGDATIPPTALPTQEAVDEVITRRPAVVTRPPEVVEEEAEEEAIPLKAAAEEAVAPYPEDRPEPGVVGAPNPKYRKVVFTGQMKAGKDYVAEAAGYTIVSLAEPLYMLLDFFFGIPVAEKDTPGARRFMQVVGTWGRGDITTKEPVTPERAIFVRMIQTLGEHDALPMGDTVDWKSFGKDQNIWLNACIKRADAILAGDDNAKVAVVNGRFENEIKAFDQAGWARFHVMASALALKQRREKDNVQPAALQHASEALAVHLDKGSLTVAQKSGKQKINVVWNDPAAGRPSSKFYSLREFIATVNTAE